MQLQSSKCLREKKSNQKLNAFLKIERNNTKTSQFSTATCIKNNGILYIVVSDYGIYTHTLDPGTAAAPNYIFDTATALSHDLYIICTDSTGSIPNNLLNKVTVEVVVGDRVEYTSIPSNFLFLLKYMHEQYGRLFQCHSVTVHVRVPLLPQNIAPTSCLVTWTSEFDR